MKNNYAMNLCKISGTEFYGKKLPSGAIYGIDKHGAFICLDYKIINISKAGRPALNIMRYNDRKDRWFKHIEANIITEYICDFYFNNEDKCQIDAAFIDDIQAGKEHQYHIEMLKIAEDFGVEHNGYNVPKGAMYGIDEAGAFICQNYKLKGKGYIDGMPCLVIIRPQKRASKYSNPFYEKQGTGYLWHKTVEHNNTTLAIMRMFDKYAEKCVVEYLPDAETVAKSATKSKGLDYHDPVHFTSIHGKNSILPNKNNSFCALSREKSLDEMAKFQKGKYIW